MGSSSPPLSHSSLNALSSEATMASESPALPIVEIESPNDGFFFNEIDNDSSSTMDSNNSVSVSSNPGPESERTVPSSSAAAGAHSRPTLTTHRSRSFNHTPNQNQQHYHPRRFPSQHRGDGFNRRGGNREYGNQNYSNRRHQQQGFSARAVNSPHWPHEFGNGLAGFLGPQPLPHSHPQWNAIFNTPYVNEFPPPLPIPGYMPHYGYYGNPFFQETYNALYGFPVPVLAPHPEVTRGPALSPQPRPPHNFSHPEVLLCNRILKQIEYYFSYQNLPTDGYLRFQMDEQGWVPLGVIAEFPRVKDLTTDIQLILRALQSSLVVEVQGDRLRKRGDWMAFIQPRHSSSTTQTQPLQDMLLSGIQNIHLDGGEEAPAAAASDIE
ncbi:hypothetical protein HHK36_008943 [Tetracentron sinense]|uniref:HTH La-type RNA-binding domain-containing protein n=1 Tax=Tetracentron sinense TaxID=13715 RepID=A0A834ZCQ7_TETSI|nr:hypothetical protein HHK36_008943 [Tetracentron sinense]